LSLWEWHPSRKIVGELPGDLAEKKIALGVTSSAAIYKSLDLARELMRLGADVHVVMSSEAARLISPTLFEWATGNPVLHGRFSGEVGHVALAEACDALVVAPATASTLAKIASGVADTAVTLLAQAFIGAGKPVLAVPAMHKALYDALQKHGTSAKLESLGVVVHEPELEGDRVKFPQPSEVAWHVEALVARGKDLAGLKVLATAGPTREYIDSVRFITNASTGKMGVSIAVEALFRGAAVSLVHGPLAGTSTRPLRRTKAVETTDEMLDAVLKELSDFKPDAVVLAAAPSDFKPSKKAPTKMDSNSPVSLELVATPKIAEHVAEELRGRGVFVIFSAEVASSDEELLARALKKKEKYKADAVVANNVARKDIGFASDYNEVLIVYGEENAVEKVQRTSKRIVARCVLDVVKALVGKARLR